MKEKNQVLQFEFNKEKLDINCTWGDKASKKKYSFYDDEGEEVEDFIFRNYTTEFCEAWQENLDIIFEKIDLLLERTTKKIVFQAFTLTKIKR
jgi:hypothetical protein